MSTYAIPRKIRRFEIFRPGMPLKTWLDRQTDKPDILLNCSLYTAKMVPCGTIWEDGKLVSDQGKGFGFGTTRRGQITSPAITASSIRARR